MSDLSPQMERLLSVLRPGIVENSATVQKAYYGVEPGRFGYVHAGRGGTLTATFKALERRGLVERVRDEYLGWRLL